MPDMTNDVFADSDFGRAALKQLAPIPENFRLYSAGWLGDGPADFNVMEVVGAEFREAKSGPYKGKLSVLVLGSVRKCWVSKADMSASKKK